ncbi:MAG: hypothetical protein WBO70_01185 [Erysipelotrichaceae bacterium]
MNKCNKDVIYVKLFGDFKLYQNETVLSTNQLSDNICHLISYLIYHRYDAFSLDSLIEAIIDKDVSNPKATLKNLVYRFRKIAEDNNFKDYHDIILSQDGVYKINNNLLFNIDIENFNLLHNQIQDETDNTILMPLLTTAFNYYKQDFISILKPKIWSLSIQQNYRNAYFNIVYKILDFYYKNDDYKNLYDFATKAIKIDEYEEGIHQYICYSLAKLNDKNQAINYYKYVSDLFYNGLGSKLSNEFINMYHSICQTDKNDNVEITKLSEYLQETKDEIEGAYYCDLEVFKQLYRISSRTISRTANSIYILVLTVSPLISKTLDNQVKEKAMKTLNTCINTSLRTSDVYTRSSANQFTIMLHLTNHEDTKTVANRIIKKFESTYISKKLFIDISINKIEPI